jgi:hypothetical protein
VLTLFKHKLQYILETWYSSLDRVASHFVGAVLVKIGLALKFFPLVWFVSVSLFEVSVYSLRNMAYICNNPFSISCRYVC